jgi:hypothetical protein
VTTIQLQHAYAGLNPGLHDLGSSENARLVGLDLARYYTAGMDGDNPVLSLAQVEALQAIVDADYNTHEPLRGAALATAIQFRGAADTASSLGTLGLVVNSASDAAAGARLAASDADWTSEINGSGPYGRARFIGRFNAAVTRVHLAQLGLTAPLTDNGSGPVLAASNQMTELTFDAALNVVALVVVEGGPTNFAGASGTGSARWVTVYGLSPVVA